MKLEGGQKNNGAALGGNKSTSRLLRQIECTELGWIEVGQFPIGFLSCTSLFTALVDRSLVAGWRQASEKLYDMTRHQHDSLRGGV